MKLADAIQKPVALFLLIFFSFSSFGVGAQTMRRQSKAAVSGSTVKGQLDIVPPSTDNFFMQGRQIFPGSTQYPIERFAQHNAFPSLKVSDSYPVGPGDKFLVSFWGKIEDNIIVTVNSESQLFIPRVGIVEAKDKTYRELQVAVTELIRSKMKGLDFTVSLYMARRFDVYVLGAVLAPGQFPVSAGMRASDAIAAARGLLPVGSTQYIEIRRADEVLRVDLLNFYSLGDFSLNPYVKEGDVIFVPNLNEFVTIRGAVVGAGTFEIKDTKNFKEVIEAMGGYSVYADLSRPIRLSRLSENGNRVKRSVIHNERQRQSREDILIDQFELQNGDEIFVPSSNILIPSRANVVYVTGEVRTPGALPYETSATVEEYIGAAGGLSKRADFSKAVIYKTDGSTEKAGPRMIIEPGDTLYLPERTFKFWDDHLKIVTTFIGLATSIIVLSSR